MAKVVYEVVEHDGGWAYKLGDVFSEPFASRQEAEAAAETAAAEHEQPGETELIEYEDEKGNWHTELASGEDRPDAEFQNDNTPRRED
jgi:hypothetical protein